MAEVVAPSSGFEVGRLRRGAPTRVGRLVEPSHFKVLKGRKTALVFQKPLQGTAGLRFYWRRGRSVAMIRRMNKRFLLAGFLPFALAVASGTALAGDKFKTTLFEDDFSGAKLKKEWGSWKSESFAKDGVLVGVTPEAADHPSVNTIQLAPVADLEVAVSFQFHGSPSFSVMFRDLAYKGSHAGHICHVAVSPKAVTLYDGKTGIFRKDVRDRRKAGEKLDQETQEMLKKKTSRNPVDLDPKAWHDLVIRIEGDALEVSVDGKKVGRLQSEGIAHKTKSNMNITTVKREVHYDRFAIRTR